MCDDVAESGYSAESIRKACSKLTAHIYRSDFIASDMMQKINNMTCDSVT